MKPLLILLMLMAVGCKPEHKPITTHKKKDVINGETVRTHEGTYIQKVNIDGCMYLIMGGNPVSMIHHAACPNPIHKDTCR